RIRILSIGTGAERFTYPRKPGIKARAWGFMTAWQRGKLVELMLSLQSQAATNMASLLLGKEQVLRLNFFDSRLPMDDPTTIADFVRARMRCLPWRARTSGNFWAPSSEQQPTRSKAMDVIETNLVQKRLLVGLLEWACQKIELTESQAALAADRYGTIGK